MRINSLRQATGCWQWRRRLRSLKMPRYCEKPGVGSGIGSGPAIGYRQPADAERCAERAGAAGDSAECAAGREHQQSAGGTVVFGSASVGIVSQQNTDISALKRFTVSAGEAVSLLARKAEMKLFAAKGKIEIRAQDDALEATAKRISP